MKDIVKESVGRTAKLILLLLVMLNVLNYTGRLIVSVAMESIRLDLGFSDTQMGMLQGVFLLGVGLLILPAGILVDRWSRKKAISLMAILWSIATIVTGMCSSFVTLLISRFLTSTGEAGFQPGGTAWLSVVFPKKDRTRVNGIFLMGGVLGCAIGMAGGGLLISKTGNWRVPFFVFGFPGIILGLLTLAIKETRPPKTDREPLGKSIRGLFSKKSFIGASLAQGLFLVLSMSVLSWNAVLFMRAYDVKEAHAGAVLGLICIPAALASVLGGVLADKLNKRTANGRPLFAAIVCIITAIVYAFQFMAAGRVPYLLYIVLMGLAFSLGSMPIPVFQVINMDVFPANLRGTASSMTGLISFLLFTWWGSILIGRLSDVWGGGLEGLKYAMMITIPFPILAGFVCLWTCRHYIKEVKQIGAEESDSLEETPMVPANA